ncbi:hypothetical protein LINPERPRIM_LOCUS717 [Linum perenne]
MTPATRIIVLFPPPLILPLVAIHLEGIPYHVPRSSYVLGPYMSLQIKYPYFPGQEPTLHGHINFLLPGSGN